MKKKVTREFLLEPGIGAVYREFDEYLNENLDRIKGEIERYERRAEESRLTYGGRRLAVGFYPVILSEKQVTFISGVVESIIRLMEKATRLFLEEAEVREAFAFEPERIELIEVDPGYEPAIPCARFDSFFDGHNLRFTELNTDGAAGMDGAEKIAKLFLEAPMIRNFFSGRPTRVFDIRRSVLETLLNCYRQFAGRNVPDKPRIAIVDWKEVRTYAEFVSFQEFCREHGYDAVIADPRELDYDGRTLSHHGLKIDLIYRRVVSTEYIQRLDEVVPMTRAFKDHNVCVVGSFRSDVAFSKRVFGLLHNPAFARFFTAEERGLVQRHIPWTRPFKEEECDYRDSSVRMPDLARNEKNNFVLKPSNLYEGRGVAIGVGKSRDEWEHQIEVALKGDYVLQELIAIPSMRLGVWHDTFQIETRMIHLGEYLFGGRFSGFYCRASLGPLIDRSSREFLAPCFVLAE